MLRKFNAFEFSTSPQWAKFTTTAMMILLKQNKAVQTF